MFLKLTLWIHYHPLTKRDQLGDYWYTCYWFDMRWYAYQSMGWAQLTEHRHHVQPKCQWTLANHCKASHASLWDRLLPILAWRTNVYKDPQVHSCVGSWSCMAPLPNVCLNGHPPWAPHFGIAVRYYSYNIMWVKKETLGVGICPLRYVGHGTVHLGGFFVVFVFMHTLRLLFIDIKMQRDDGPIFI